MTFAAAWTVISETLALASLDAASQKGASSMNQDGRIRVRWHRGELTLTACIRHHHTGPSPGMMVWGAIGYTSRSLLVCIDGTLNSACYISGVLRNVALLFIRVLRNPTFKQDNARPNVAVIVRTFLDTGNVRALR
ncbi:transposable element Tcb1 transposase [Trichonephila clavipes]|nr:transposable element Tcb1 transposase [Trichonephila clavipes]